jgi:hypothetical protein
MIPKHFTYDCYRKVYPKLKDWQLDEIMLEDYDNYLKYNKGAGADVEPDDFLIPKTFHSEIESNNEYFDSIKELEEKRAKYAESLQEEITNLGPDFWNNLQRSPLNQEMALTE